MYVCTFVLTEKIVPFLGVIPFCSAALEQLVKTRHLGVDVLATALAEALATACDVAAATRNSLKPTFPLSLSQSSKALCLTHCTSDVPHMLQLILQQNRQLVSGDALALLG